MRLWLPALVLDTTKIFSGPNDNDATAKNASASGATASKRAVHLWSSPSGAAPPRHRTSQGRRHLLIAGLPAGALPLIGALLRPRHSRRPCVGLRTYVYDRQLDDVRPSWSCQALQGIKFSALLRTRAQKQTYAPKSKTPLSFPHRQIHRSLLARPPYSQKPYSFQSLHQIKVAGGVWGGRC